MYKECMADIETLGTRPDCVVLSIALVKFDLDGEDTFESILDDPSRVFYTTLDTAAQSHRTIQQSTLDWWKQFPQQRELIDSARKHHPRDALIAVNNWVENDKPNLWGNGATFDNVIINDLYETFAVNSAFPYYQARDLRTLKQLAGKPKLPFSNPQPHNALYDAAYEVLCAQEYYRRLC